MLKEEAHWLGEQLRSLPPAEVFPLCNIGSSTRVFRETVQPWIDEQLFAPTRAAGHTVIHVDLKAEDGVDLVGDIADPAFVDQLASRGFKSVLCSNLIEHVPDAEELCRSLWSVVPAGGLLIVTGPHSYPIHLDPIDNGFRSSPEELAARFPGSTILESAIVSGGTYASQLFSSPAAFFGDLSRVFTPFIRPKQWVSKMRRWAWLNRPFETSCLVLRKDAAAR